LSRNGSASRPWWRDTSGSTPLSPPDPHGAGEASAGHDPEAYGLSIAEEYDALYDDVLDTATTVAVLVDLAGGGPVLEFGIGTGRLALPLAATGLDVVGVEASELMVDQLRAKPGGERIPVAIGDFADVRVPGRFSLVVLAFNTIFALPTEDAQVACFVNAARHLVPGGRFVVDSWVLDPARFTEGASVAVRYVTSDRVSLDAAVYDAVTSRMQTVQVVLSDGRARLFPANHRYVGPTELDLMARVAGLDLEARWAGWDRAPFGADSRAHVSVYRRWPRPG
jgi:SAM-dependent methyltransferase